MEEFHNLGIGPMDNKVPNPSRRRSSVTFLKTRKNPKTPEKNPTPNFCRENCYMKIPVSMIGKNPSVCPQTMAFV